MGSAPRVYQESGGVAGEIAPLSRGRGPGARRKRPKWCQKKGHDLPPSVTFRRDPLNAYDYRAVPESLRGIIRLANSANVWRFRTCGRLYLYDTLLKRLTPHVQDVAAELRPCILRGHPVVREGHLARPRPLAAPDPPHSRNGLRRGTTWAAGDQGHAPAGAAGDVRGMHAS
jgi:hypothetical protein